MTSSPMGIDMSLSLDSLSHDQRVTFCEWFESTFDQGTPFPDQPSKGGYEINLGYTYCGTDGGDTLCVPQTSVNGCLANLAATHCTATVGQVGPCLSAFANECAGFDDACAAYHDNPTCVQTLVVSKLASSSPNGPFGCALLVE